MDRRRTLTREDASFNGGDVDLENLIHGLPHPEFVEHLETLLIDAAREALPIVVRDVVRAKRIGLIADTHCRLDDGGDLPAQVLEAFRGVDLIIHCGDLGKLGVLDRLQSVAPVLAVRSPNDPHEAGQRLAETRRVVEAGGLRIGVTFGVSDLGIEIDSDYNLRPPSTPLDEMLVDKFGERVELLTFATTHRDLIAYQQGLLIINPGSPTAPAVRREGEIGTVAIVETHEARARVEIVHLRKDADTQRGQV